MAPVKLLRTFLISASGIMVGLLVILGLMLYQNAGKLVILVMMILFIFSALFFFMYANLERYYQHRTITDRSEEIVLNNIFEGIITTDERLYITRYNRRCQQIFGWSATEIMGKHISAVLRGSPAEEWLLFQQALFINGTAEKEFLQLTKSGEYITIAVSSALLKTQDDQMKGVVSVIRNISAKVKIIDQAQHNHPVEEMLTQQLLESHEKNDHLVKLNKRLVEVRDMERKNIADELFDELGQVLTSVKLNLSIVKDEVDMDNRPVKNLFDQSVDNIEYIFQSLKKISTSLMPKMISDLGLFRAMEEYCLQFQAKTGIMVKFNNKAGNIAFDAARQIYIFHACEEICRMFTPEADLKEIRINITAETHLLLRIDFIGVNFAMIELFDHIRQGGKQLDIIASIIPEEKITTVTFLVPLNNMHN